MNRWLPLAVLSLALLVPTVLAADADVEGQQVTFDSREATCQWGETCSAPAVSGRLEAGDAAAKIDEKDPCLSEPLGDGETVDPACEPAQPTVDPGVLRLYFQVDGLPSEETSADQDAGAAPPAEAGWTGLSTGTQAALLMGALGVSATGAVAVVGLRRILTFLLAPLAARLEPSKLLDDDNRRRIYESIREEPGINLRGLADNLDLAWGTLLHHLHKLEKAHMVVSRRYGKYRRYFVNGSTFTRDEQARLAALSTPSTARVAEYILENPGTTQAEVGEGIGVTPSTVLWHARRLTDVGLIEARREGRYVRYFPQIEGREQAQLAAASA